MKRTSYILLAALLLATTIVGPHEILAQAAKRKKEPFPSMPLPVIFDGEPLPTIWCGSCYRGTCMHYKRPHSEAYDIGSLTYTGSLLKFLLQKKPTSGTDALGKGFRVQEWTRMIRLSYGPARCLCAPQCTWRCGGVYILTGKFIIRLKFPIDFAKWRLGRKSRNLTGGLAGMGKPRAWWPWAMRLSHYWEFDRRAKRLSTAVCKCCVYVPPPPPPKKKYGLVTPTWPGTAGVLCSICPTGNNYGAVCDVALTNTTDEEVACTLEEGTRLDSNEPGVQDLVVADVPTETPCSGAKEIGQPISIGPGETYVISDVPGFCPDFELAPPDEGLTDIYTARPPDEKSKALVETVHAVKNFDVGKVKLEVFEKEKAREMICQGACWMVDSRIDEVEGNEVTAAALTDRYWTAFETSAAGNLAQMTPEQREESEKLVRDDLKAIVAATSFVAKEHL